MKRAFFIPAWFAALFLAIPAFSQESVKIIPQWSKVGESLLYHVETTVCEVEGRDSTTTGPDNFDFRLVNEQLTPEGGILLRSKFECLPPSITMTDQIRKKDALFVEVLKEEMNNTMQFIDGYVEFDSKGHCVRRSSLPDADKQIMEKLRSLCGNRTDVYDLIKPMYEKIITPEILDQSSGNNVNVIFMLNGTKIPLGNSVESMEASSMELPGIGQVSYKAKVVRSAEYVDDSKSALSVRILMEMAPEESKRLVESLVDFIVKQTTSIMGNAISEADKAAAREAIKKEMGEMSFDMSSAFTYRLDAQTHLPQLIENKSHVIMNLGAKGKTNTTSTTIYSLE